MAQIEIAETSGRWLEVLRVSLRLGLTSFGGPIAHLGYYHQDVVHRRWLDEQTFVDLMPVAQSMLRGVNAAVVGLLLGALHHPVWTSAIGSSADFALATALASYCCSCGRRRHG